MIKRKNSNQKNPANFDNEKGIGRSKYHSSKQYDSVEVLMKPSIFLKLAYPLETPIERSYNFISKHIDENLPVAVPFLILIKLENGEFQVEGHEGRHRTTIIKRKFGDIPSKVLLIFENFVAGDLIKTLNKINYGIFSEKDIFIEGPLFEY